MKLKFIINKLMLFFVIYLVAASSFYGYFQKRGFNDNDSRTNLRLVMNGSASKPFVYRQLLPEITELVYTNIPTPKKTTLESNLLKYDAFQLNRKFVKTTDGVYLLKYYLMYIITFGFYLLSLIMLMMACYQVTKNSVASVLAAFTFALFFPLLETIGGYYYDCAELFFYFLSILLIIRRQYLMFIVLVPFAVYNKESYLFFVLTLFPLLYLDKDRGLYKRLIVFAIALFISIIVNILVKKIYLSNSGGVVEYHLLGQISYFINPRNFFQKELNYGIYTGQGFFFLSIFFVAYIFKNSWSKFSPALKKYTLLSVVVNFILFILFCYPSELRNLSMCYFPFVLSLSFFYDSILKKTGNTDELH